MLYSQLVPISRLHCPSFVLLSVNVCLEGNRRMGTPTFDFLCVFRPFRSQSERTTKAELPFHCESIRANEKSYNSLVYT